MSFSHCRLGTLGLQKYATGGHWEAIEFSILGLSLLFTDKSYLLSYHFFLGIRTVAFVRYSLGRNRIVSLDFCVVHLSKQTLYNFYSPWSPTQCLNECQKCSYKKSDFEYENCESGQTNAKTT